MIRKILICLVFSCIFLAGSSQGYPGSYPLDDHFTRGLLTRAFNMPQDVITFGIYWNDLCNTYYETSQHSNNLGSVVSIDYHTTSPDLLITDYQDRVRTLNSQISSITATNMARIDRNVRELGESIASMARRNNVTTGNADTDWLIKEVLISGAQEVQKKNYDQQMRQVKYEAEQELRRELKERMDPIKESVIADNLRLAEDYLKSAAYEDDEKKEEYFLACHDFHNCFVEEVNNNYSIYSADWMTPNCQKPRMFYATSLNSQDYIQVAFRKKAAYEKNLNPDYEDAIRMYLEAGLSTDNKNPQAYKLMSELEDNVIDKRFYALMAVGLDETNHKLRRYSDGIDKRYTKELFLSIREGDTQFVKRSIKYKFHLGQKYQNKSTIEQAIDHDQSDILRLLIDDMPDRDVFLMGSGHPLVFHASAVNAPKCLKLLDSYGVALEFSDPSNTGLTALNIALINNSKNAATYLYNKYGNYKPCLQYAKLSSKQDLNTLSLYLYGKSRSNLGAIQAIYPDFLGQNYGNMNVRVQPRDAEIYLNGTYKGTGTISIDDLLLTETYNLRIEKSGLQTASKAVKLKQGKAINVDVILQKPAAPSKRYLTHYDTGYEIKTMEDFYVQPDNLKKDKKRNREFNNAQIKAAEEKAQKIADFENEHIQKKLETANTLIKKENQEIARQNDNLNDGRLYSVSYVDHNGGATSTAYADNSSEKVIEPKIANPDVSANARSYQASSVGSSTSIQSPSYSGPVSLIAAEVNMGAQNIQSINKPIPEQQANSASYIDRPENNKSITSTANSTSTTKKGKLIIKSSYTNKLIAKENQYSQESPPVTLSNSTQAEELIANKPLSFNIERLSDNEDWIKVKINDNKSLNYTNSSAKVWITSEKGVQRNYSDSYEGGTFKFYPFSGKGTYSLFIDVKYYNLEGELKSGSIRESLTIQEDPDGLLGEIRRIRGNYISFACSSTNKVYPGMHVIVSRLESGKISEIACGNITHQSGQEWTIELTQIQSQPGSGDLILTEL